MNKTLVVNILVLFTLANGPGAARADGSPNADATFTVGQWIGHVVRDQDGRFGGCSIRAIAPDHQSGIQLSIFSADAGLRLVLQNNSWHFGEQPVQMRLRVGGYDLGLRTMEPSSGGMVNTNLGSDRATQVALSSGNILEALIGSDRKTFSLEGSNQALLALVDCVQSRLGRPNVASASTNGQQTALPAASMSANPAAGDKNPQAIGQAMNAVPVPPSTAVILTCSLTSGATDRWLADTDQSIARAAGAAAKAGFDSAETYQSLVAERNANTPQPTVVVLELDESRKMIPNRQSLISWGPEFTSIEVRWRETYSDGVHEAVLNRVTGGVMVHKIAVDGADGELLYHGTCAVTHRAF